MTQPNQRPANQPPLPPKSSQEKPLVSTQVANVNQKGQENDQSGKTRTSKILIIITILLLALAAVAGGYWLIKENQDIRESAASVCPNGDQGQAGQECSNLNKCDVAGGCNGACCASDSDCPSGQTCSIPNGYCRKGKSCNDSGTSEHHKECRSNQCVEVAGSGSDQCSSHSQCQSPTATPTSSSKNYNSCSAWGYQNDPTCTADPNCTSAGQDGFCCLNNNSTPVCCYRNGECFEGQQGNCEDRGNGKIWLSGGLTVEVYKMTGSSVSCPYSSSDRTTVFSGVTQSGGQEFSLGSNECGQIDAIGYCGSCKAGCTPAKPTSTPVPPSPTPAPSPTPEPSPTPTEYSCNCHTINIYDESKNLIAKSQLSNLKAGDLIYIGVVANNGFPSYSVDKARIRVNRNYWLDSDESSEKTTNYQSGYLSEFIKSYILPEGVLNFKIEAEIHLGGSSSVSGWY